MDLCLQDCFCKNDIRTMDTYGLDSTRIYKFIKAIELAGGEVSRLTLSTAAWIKLFGMDEDAEFLINGCAYGFTWEATSPPEFYEVPNYVDKELESRVTARVLEELTAGHIVATTRDKVDGIAAIGVVDKARSGFKKYRVVLDLSRPHGASVNDGIDLDKRKFASFQSACNYMQPGAYHCKVYLANAYRSVPMAPEWWPRHAFQWEGVVYSDIRMPFGNRGAPAAFGRITQAIVRLFKSRGYPAFVGYLDDFWLLVNKIR